MNNIGHPRTVLAISLFVLLCAACTTNGSGQNHSRSSIETGRTNRLSEPFAKAALRALFAIKADDGEHEQSASAAPFRPLVDAASAEAKSKSELLAVQDLNGFAFMKIMNNLTRAVRYSRIRLEANGTFFGDTYANDPTVVRLNKQDEGCENEIEEALRMRVYKVQAEACKRD